MSTTLRLMFISMLMVVLCQIASAQTIYIVRHAEKELSSSNPKDPALTVAGLERSFALKEKLKKIQLKAIYSTNFRRTKETAAPVANDKGLEIQIYDPSDLDSLAKRIKELFRGGSVLIIGHSNTILETVKAFGGTPSKERIDDQDYSNMFIVRVSKKGKVHTEAILYGQ